MAAELEFCLLGPVTVRLGGGLVPVPHGGQRTVLAVLLLHAGQVVSTDQLAEALWGQRPPPSARVAVRNHVMRLRHRLGKVAAARIRTQPPGYLISVGPQELDLSRFETLLTSARMAAADGSWDTAAAHADAALAMWRGEPLEDIDSEALVLREVPRLAELRLQSTETRIEAELRLGRHAGVVAELERLAALHPLREHLHALLMSALTVAGRQAEALQVYQRARQMLVDELGVEPGPELREFHRQILSGGTPLALARPGSPGAASALARPGSPGAASALARPGSPGDVPGAVPRQLPTAVRHFVGRRAELETLVRLSGEPRTAGNAVVISAIDGMAGIGKTALAVHAAHRLAEDFPDGQLFIDLHGYTEGRAPRAAGDALDWLLRALSVPPQRIPPDTEGRAALYRQRLAGTRTLILLDNAASEHQVRPLLPGSPGCLVLVTSRRRLKGLDDARTLSLDVLPETDAIALLRTVIGPGRVSPDDPVLSEIAELCGQLPLALRIAGAQLRHRPAWSAEHLASLLRDQRQRITALWDGERDLGVVFGLSYKGLPGTHQRLFRCLGLIPGPDTDPYAAAAMIGTDPAAAFRMLEDLVDHNLLSQHVPGRYQLHDLIRLHTQTLAGQDPLGERDAAVDRLLDYYLHTAGRADALVTSFPPRAPYGKAPAYAPALPDPDAAWAWLRTERPNLHAVLQHITAQGPGARTIAVSSGLCTLLHVDGPWTQGIAVHAAAADAAHALGDQANRADALARLGYMRGLTGDFPRAVHDLRHALRLYREIADRHGQAAALNVLGELQRVTGDLPGAAPGLREALRLYREVGDRLGQAGVLIQLGDMRRVAGDIPQADHDLQQALELYRELGNRLGEADVLLRLGDVRRTTGDFSGAIRDLREALRLYRELSRWLGQANALARLGDIWQATGDLPGAARDLLQALRLYQDLGHQLGQGNTLTFLGQVRLAEGDHPGAAHHLEAAVDLFRRIGAHGNQAWALNHYASVIAATGDHAQAGTCYQDALRLAREAHHPDDEARALEGIGECQLRTGDADGGLAHLESALQIFQHLAMKPDADRVGARLAQLRATSNAK